MLDSLGGRDHVLQVRLPGDRVVKVPVEHAQARRMRISVRAGEVKVRAPYGCGETEITKFLHDNASWIADKLQVEPRQPPSPPAPRTGVVAAKGLFDNLVMHGNYLTVKLPPDDRILEVPLQRSRRRRSLLIRIQNGEVILRVPERSSKKEIAEFLNSRAEWIAKTLERHPKPEPVPPLADGDEVMYLGEWIKVTVNQVKGDRGWVSLMDPTPILHVPRMPPDHEKEFQDRLLRKWYVQRAEEILVPRCAEIAQRTGLKPDKVRIGYGRRTWGHCRGPRKSIVDKPSEYVITLSYRLVKTPMFAIDSVIVHEQCHIKEMNHGERFWALVRQHDPDLDKADRWLKENDKFLESPRRPS